MTSCQGQGGTGTLITYAQGMGLWINNGGPAAAAPIAAAIMMAESGGCTTAQNPTDNGGTQTSWGLWQISNGTHSMPVANIYDPNVNAQQAVAKYRAAGNQFSPWGTYNSGAYTKYLSPGTTPDTSVPGTAQTTAATSGDDCAFQLGGQHIGSIIGINVGPSLPSVCLISKSEIRAFLGAGLIVGGAVPMMVGALILAAFAFRASGAQGAVTKAAAVIPTPAGKLAQAGTAAGARSRARAAGP
jgi:hypothetical protein